MKDLLAGRRFLDDAIVESWPRVAPRDLARSIPVSVCWSPIVLCNLQCPHCLDDKSVGERDKAFRTHIAHLIARARPLGVDISGGEPLLIPELPQLLRIVTNGGIAVGITTNGWFLAERIAELEGTVDAVRVSLDGPNAKGHDRLRGAGSYKRALRGLRAAVRQGVPVQVHFVAMASTVDYLQALVDLAAAEGAYGLTVLQMLPIGEGTHLAKTEMLDDDEVERIVAELRVPPGLLVRSRARKDAAGFTVVRADGSVWRNIVSAQSIRRIRTLTRPEDLRLEGPDGAA